MSNEEFIRWVAEWVFDENFELNANGFVELACRKLYKLGYVDKTDGHWVLKEN